MSSPCHGTTSSALDICLEVWGPGVAELRPHKHNDPIKHEFWYPPCVGPWNQNVRSFCLCRMLGSWLFRVWRVWQTLATPDCLREGSTQAPWILHEDLGTTHKYKLPYRTPWPSFIRPCYHYLDYGIWGLLEVLKFEVARRLADATDPMAP